MLDLAKALESLAPSSSSSSIDVLRLTNLPKVHVLPQRTSLSRQSTVAGFCLVFTIGTDTKDDGEFHSMC